MSRVTGVLGLAVERAIAGRSLGRSNCVGDRFADSRGLALQATSLSWPRLTFRAVLQKSPDAEGRVAADFLRSSPLPLTSIPSSSGQSLVLNESFRKYMDLSPFVVPMSFAKTLAKHRRGILAWYDYAISTGPPEGTNNKIKTMQRQAYGFRDREFFVLKIMAIHEASFQLIR